MANVRESQPTGAFTALGLQITYVLASLTIIACPFLSGCLETISGPVAGGSPASNIAMWSPDGGWSPMGAGLDNLVFALAVDSSGNVYAGGRFGPGAIARWRSSDSVWEEVEGGVDGVVWTIAAVGNKVFVGGEFAVARDRHGASSARGPLVYWDGGTWHTVPLPGESMVSTLVARDSSLFIAAGSSLGESNRVYRFDMSTGNVQVVAACDSVIGDICVVGDHLYVCGGFLEINKLPISYLARIDLESGVVDGFPDITAISPQNRNGVGVIAPDGGYLYLSGSFAVPSGTTTARLDIASGRIYALRGPRSGFADMIRVGDVLIAIGIGTDDDSQIGLVDPWNIAMFNPMTMTWSTFGGVGSASQVDPVSASYAIVRYRNGFVIGGKFTALSR